MNAIENFFAAWSITDPIARLDSIESSLSSEFSYVDPRTPEPLTNASALAEYLGAFIEAAPGATAKVVKSDLTGGMHRVTVAFTMASGMEQLGQYFIRFDDEDRISEMTGFVGTGTVD